MSAMTVFVNGILGVFLGMAALYACIRLPSLAVERLPRKDEK